MKFHIFIAVCVFQLTKCRLLKDPVVDHLTTISVLTVNVQELLDNILQVESRVNSIIARKFCSVMEESEILNRDLPQEHLLFRKSDEFRTIFARAVEAGRRANVQCCDERLKTFTERKRGNFNENVSLCTANATSALNSSLEKVKTFLPVIDTLSSALTNLQGGSRTPLCPDMAGIKNQDCIEKELFETLVLYENTNFAVHRSIADATGQIHRYCETLRDCKRSHISSDTYAAEVLLQLVDAIECVKRRNATLPATKRGIMKHWCEEELASEVPDL